jgi:hypothetical protein
VPSTVKVPSDPETVPTEFGEPSPQSMMAVKSDATLKVSASVKPPIVVVNCSPVDSDRSGTGAAVRGAS